VNTYIEVDARRCTGHARCYLSAAPDLLGEDEEGFVSLRGGRALVPPGQVPAAEEARSSCPEGAITVYREDSRP
jgi:ferredoxin